MFGYELVATPFAQSPASRSSRLVARQSADGQQVIGGMAAQLEWAQGFAKGLKEKIPYGSRLGLNQISNAEQEEETEEISDVESEQIEDVVTVAEKPSFDQVSRQWSALFLSPSFDII